MEFTIASVLALFTLLTASSGAFLISKKINLPYTVLLVGLGLIIASLSKIFGLHFITEFSLTPDLLFYVFLPVLLFESSYHMNISKVMENIRLISLLAILGFLISAFSVAGILYGLLSLFGISIPFIITLLFGALISSTDPVAVLSLFKEFGAPRKLSLIFEGESLFNDGTAVALFLIVLAIIEHGYYGTTTLISGITTFGMMIIGGIFFGIIMGVIFTKIITYLKHYEFAGITVTIAMAHLTFILSEVISTITIGNFNIAISPIIATVIASLFIGNYGRLKFSPKSEEFIEKFWAQSAFMANSLVFLLLGILIIQLDIPVASLWLPILLGIVAVIIGRVISIYPLVRIFNTTEPADPTYKQNIPTSWQHLLAWGGLRGALAITLVLLIPADLAVTHWAFSGSIQEFILALTAGTIVISLFIQATTIAPLMKRWKIDALSDVEKIEYDESRALVHARILGKLAQFKKKGYISSDVFEQLHQTHLEAFSKWCSQRTSDTAESVNTGTYVADRVLRMHAIGIEKLFLKELYTYDEINEAVYKRLLAKLGLQMQSLEFGSLPTNTSDEHDKLDIFERLANMMRKYSSLNKDKAIQDKYLYYRAQMILSRKVIKEFSELFNLDCETVTLSKSHAHIFDEQALGRIMEVYLSFRENSTKKMLEVEATHPSIIQKLSLELAHRGLVKIEEKIIDDLLEKEIISPKIALVLSSEKV